MADGTMMSKQQEAGQKQDRRRERTRRKRGVLPYLAVRRFKGRRESAVVRLRVSKSHGYHYSLGFTTTSQEHRTNIIYGRRTRNESVSCGNTSNCGAKDLGFWLRQGLGELQEAIAVLRYKYRR
eukprot:scaffold2448_cov155-Amphora_coffeaeformis.AAC.4